MTIKANVLEELKEMLLTKAIGSKPNTQDVHHWEQEATDIASSIQMNLFPKGQVHGHLAIVILKEEYQLPIEN